MKKSLVTFLVVLCASIISVHAAMAAVFETPFVDNTGIQVPLSEGKVDEYGYCKVEIPTGLTEPTTFAICYYDLINGYQYMGYDETEDCELKYECEQPIPAGSHPAFGFSVHPGSADCSADPMWVSGFTL